MYRVKRILLCVFFVILMLLISLRPFCRYISSEGFASPSLLLKDQNNIYTLSVQNKSVYVYLKERKVLSEHRLEKELAISSCTADLDHDGRDELILLCAKESKEYGDDLVVFSFISPLYNSSIEDNKPFKEIYRFSCKGLNPWKVQTSDVDGDGSIEISIGVFKTSHFHPVMAKRPFLYVWKNGGIFPKWRGSRLSRPFDDYVFSDLDLDGKDELVSIEHLVSGEKVLTSYSWKGFGFEKTGESRSFNNILNIVRGSSMGKEDYEIFAKTKENSSWTPSIFYYKDGKLLTRE
ncbi:MAG: hypothetical protein ACOYWZ_17705 [Bacillota bacterium]